MLIRMQRTLWMGLSLSLISFLGCGGDDGGGGGGDFDAGGRDTGTPDVDAGPPDIDAGPPDVDAGEMMDAGTPEMDAGPPDVDASSPDPDAGPRIPEPRAIAPLSTSRASSQQPSFRWELPAGADGARVEICSDPACTTVETHF